MIHLLLATLTAFPILVSAQTEAPASSGAGPTIPVERHAAITGQGYFPVAIRLHDGRIAVVMRGGAGHLGLTGRLDMIFSSDEGKTWSKPVVVNDSPIDDRNHSYVYRSTDDGQTWERLSEIGDGKQQLNETALERMPDGRILAAMRSRAGEVWLSESADNGVTWAPTRQLTPVNVHPADLLLLPNGRVLITVGNRVGPTGVLGMVGDSRGQFDFEKRFALVDDALGRDCGYPSSIALKDGRVLTLYYATRVKHEPAWKAHCGAVIFTPPAR